MPAAPKPSPSPVPTVVSPPPNSMGGRFRRFWDQISEGQAVNEMWTRFYTDARTSYRFYSRDVDQEDLQGVSRIRRSFRFAGQLFWAVLMKLSPARRVVLLIGLVLLFWPAANGPTGTLDISIGVGAVYGGLLILLVLILEVADRVTMKRDLEIAREIQLWLVPDLPPACARLDIAFTTRPANTVAGDYYDVFPRSDDGRLLVVVADVAGKSIPAALLMATFQASLRTLAETGCSLMELTHGLNRYLAAHSRGGLRFTTAFIAELDPTTGSFNYVNAGHNAPALVRARKPGLERLDVGGVPLGIQGDTEYQCGSTTLASGDLVVLFTDGLVEAVNDKGEEYDEPRLLSDITRRTGNSAEVLRGVMQQVEAFVGDAPQHDDMTCVVLRYT
jgi:phosphoserine phosphatase RsbU/P